MIASSPVDAEADARGLAITVHSGLAWLREARVPVWLELSHEPETRSRFCRPAKA